MMLALLRSETADLHRQLEAVAWEEKLADGAIDPSYYASFLLAHLLAYTRVEATLHTIEQRIQPPFTPSSRLPFLRDDLHRLHVSLPVIEPAADTLVNEWEYPEWMGMNYVILGSALGGKTMLHRLRNLAVLQRTGAFSFLEFQQREGVGNWQRFQQLFRQETGTAQQQRIVKAARLTFAYFLHCFVYVDEHPDLRQVRIPALVSGDDATA